PITLQQDIPHLASLLPPTIHFNRLKPGPDVTHPPDTEHLIPAPDIPVDHLHHLTRIGNSLLLIGGALTRTPRTTPSS
uniref:Uncharacterized protein n=1 Tax=Mesocestoides corti TaxID=53468 RepID=A0A5K3EJV6_MESCO